MIHKQLIAQMLILTFICSAFGLPIVPIVVIEKNILVQSLTLYSQWKIQNPRAFINDDEKIYRQLIFLDNLQKINEHNSDPNKTFQMGLTPFVDMTEEEFVQKTLNQVIDSAVGEQISSSSIDDKSFSIKSIQNDDNNKVANSDPSYSPSLLLQIDWRSQGAVTAVKNQGNCDSSWAFSASGAMESFNYIKNNVLKQFSEQQIIDCVNPSLGYQSFGCAGGWPQHALHYAVRYGMIQSSQYPYAAKTGTCQITSHTTGYYPGAFQKVANSVASLKDALNYSPVSVVVDGSKFQFYISGIFNSCPTTLSPNQALLAVGYDSSGNWILKNSVGVAWGEAGYMRMKAGDTCGIISLKNNYRVTA